MRTLLPLFLVSLALVGCRQTSSMTEVKEDGSWSRSVTLTASDVTPDSKLKMSDVFVLPTGDGWKVEQKFENPSDGTVATASRGFKLGEECVDIQLKVDGKTVLKNLARVTETAPGVFEYRETFTWSGAVDEAELQEIVKRVTTALPEGKVVPEANLLALAKDLDRALMRVMFGPPEPMLSLAAGSPDFFARKVRGLLGKELLESADRHLASSLTAEERKALVAKLLSPGEMRQQAAEQAPEAGSDEESDDQPTTLTMVVKMPGTLESTNGLIDPVTGEVFWTMFRDAAERYPVEIFARSRR